VNGSFSYGAPAKRRRRVAAPTQRRREPARSPTSSDTSSVDRRKVGLAVLALVVLGGVAFGALTVMRDGGEVAADAARDAVGQIDAARDAEAQVTLSRVAVAASDLLARSPTGAADAVSAAALEAIEPAFDYTEDVSTGPNVVSVAATATGWSAAVSSPSGACLWIRVDPTGARTFGSGKPCTGEAAAAASDPSW
jgi:hypothetical protein